RTSMAAGSPAPGLLPIMRVAAPVRTSTPGHSTSSVETLFGCAGAASLVAFDDELNRSKGDDFKILVLPQPPSASATASSASLPAPRRAVCLLGSPPIIRLALLFPGPHHPGSPYSKPAL